MPDSSADELRASTTCAFYRIIRGEEQASMIFEDRVSLAFLDRRPLFPGHCLLVPKAHYETLADLPAPLKGG
jgi:histidine triad (HIT) family protein